MTVAAYAARRVAFSLAVFLIVSFLVFWSVQGQYYGFLKRLTITPEPPRIILTDFNRYHNGPFFFEYVKYLGDFFTGYLGTPWCLGGNR